MHPSLAIEATSNTAPDSKNKGRAVPVYLASGTMVFQQIQWPSDVRMTHSLFVKKVLDILPLMFGSQAVQRQKRLKELQLLFNSKQRLRDEMHSGSNKPVKNSSQKEKGRRREGDHSKKNREK